MAVERYEVTGTSLKSGKYSFKTIPADLQCLQDIHRIEIGGNFTNDRKSGVWTFQSDELRGELYAISGYTAPIRFEGRATFIRGEFNDNMPQGSWASEVSTVIEGKKNSPHRSVLMNVEEGTAKGKFEAQDTHEGTMVRGEFDTHGNMDKEWTFWYLKGNRKVKELRKYNEGFLIELIKTDLESAETITSIVYEDVISQLSSKNQYPSNGGVVKGEKQFESLFNNGYREDDEKRTAQEEGNSVLHEFLDVFRQNYWPNQVLEFDTDFRIAATRRFRYIYEIGEEEAMAGIRSSIANTISRIDTIRESADMRINKLKNDSLAMFYEYSGILKNRLLSVDSIIEELSTDKFHYQLRTNYYKTGIPLTCDVFTIRYDFEGAEKIHNIPSSICIDSADSLVFRLDEFVDEQIQKYLEIEGYVNKKLSKSRKSARIKQYNERIIQLRDSMEVVYLNAPVENLNDTLYRYSLSFLTEPEKYVYQNFGVNQLRELLEVYTEEKSLISKIATADKIITLLEKLIALKAPLEGIETTAAELDKAFTRYSPNPYFPRDIESRIKPHIYNRSVDILLPYYIKQIRREENIANVERIVDEIQLMRDRLLILSKMEGEEVNRLNSRIRREGQPERIKRLLGL